MPISKQTKKETNKQTNKIIQIIKFNLICVLAITIVEIIPYYQKRLRRTFLTPNTSTSLQTTLAADAHLAEDNFHMRSRHCTMQSL
jgi:hypothetical protein